MRKYLKTLPERSDDHKKRFALAVSSGATLVILALWSLTTFGTTGTLAENNAPIERAHQEVSPFESLRDGVAASWAGFSDALNVVKTGLGEMVDLEADYTEMKTDVLNTYGQ